MNANQPITRVAILGSWPDGVWPDQASYAGKWEPWFRSGTSAPWRIWQSVESELRTTIKRTGYLNIYVYFGHNLPVEYVARVQDFLVSPKAIVAPGPYLGDGESHNIWIQYQSMKRLRRKIARDDFRELPMSARQFSCSPQPISEAAWLQMYHTGLIFVADPAAAVL